MTNNNSKLLFENFITANIIIHKQNQIDQGPYSQ